MELLQLKYFVELAKSEQLTRTAEKLYISQPSLSKTISRLEEELGVELFDRVGRNIQLNNNGKIFYKYASQALKLLDDGQKSLNAASHVAPLLVETSCPRFLSKVVTNFNQRHPDIRIQTSVLHYAHHKPDLLTRRQADFFVVSPPLFNSSFVTEIISSERFFLAVPAGHRFAGRETIDLSEAKDEDFYAMSEEYSFRRLTDTLCEEAGFSPHIIAESDHIFLPMMVSSGKGVIITGESAVHGGFYPPGTCFIEIVRPSTIRQIAVLYRRHKRFTTAAVTFLEFIRNGSDFRD